MEDIRYRRTYSSTQIVKRVLNEFREILKNNTLDNAIKIYVSLTPKIVSLRPTSALLANSLKKVLIRILEMKRNLTKEKIMNIIDRIEEEIDGNNHAVAIMASKRINDDDIILTFSYSTVILKLLKNIKKEGKKIEVYIPESRPEAEGLLMAKLISQLNIPVTVFVDSAVRYFMKNVDKVVISCEAIASNGAVVNKIGTSEVALAAHEARVRIFVLAQTYKFSPETFFGELIELMKYDEDSLVNRELAEKIGIMVKASSPIFDVTPPEYIDAIITEKGVIAPQAVPFILREIYNWPLKIRDLDEIIDMLKGELK
ncbi:MAG TPA: initiation factor 2B [Thermoprotei archaeon]|nr:initiation factor 2B [Thermoprotei archaeon]